MDGTRDNSSPAARDAGLFGAPLAAARDTSFFRWFAFAQAARAPEDAPSTVVFRPSGAQFQALVRLAVRLDNGIIDGLDLTLDGPMLEGGNFPFAVDCAKSLLQALPPSPGGGLVEVIAACDQMMAAHTLHAHGSAGSAPASDVARTATRVILGNVDSCQFEDGGRLVTIENRAGIDRGRRLRIAVRRAEPTVESSSCAGSGACL